MTDQTHEHSTWYETIRAPSAERPRLTFDLDVDVCVIGAGLAGLTTAREIARRGWSVAVIEAGRLGAAASGRNVGFVLPGFSEDVGNIIERIGLDHAKQLWALSEQGVEYVRDTIRSTSMRGTDLADGWLKICKTSSDLDISSQVERLRWIGADVEAWPVERVRKVLPSERYFGAIHFPAAFHINPLNYALGLAAGAEAAGVRIFEETPAIGIDPAGVRKRVRTTSAMVRAAHVVLSGNVQLGSLMPRLAATLLPITTYVMVTEPIPDLRDVVRYRGAVSDGERGANHYRVLDDASGQQRLQWSGRITTWEGNAQRFARRLVSSARRIFPQLGEIAVAQAWSGTLGRAVHRMPQIGEIQRGLWVASGFGGHGLNTTAMAGDLLARGIVENDQTWRLFAPYELVWAGGRIGRAVVQSVYLGSRPVTAVKESLARYRHRARQRRQARMEQASGLKPMPAKPQPVREKPQQNRKTRPKKA